MAFSGRRVLIAGGTGTIGTGVAKALLSKGAKVIVTTRTLDRFEAIKKIMPADLQSNLSAVVADVNTEEGVAAIFDQSTKQPGGVQHVVAAFPGFAQGKKLVEHTLAEFNQNFKDRVVGHFLLLKAFSTYLEKQQGSTYTMLTGGAGDNYILPNVSLLCVASGALQGFSTAARAEFKNSKMAFSEFRINCFIHPKQDSQMPASDPFNIGHDLVGRAILAMIAIKSRDRNDIHKREDAEALAAK